MELFSHQNVPWEWRKADTPPETEVGRARGTQQGKKSSEGGGLSED